MSRFSSPQAQMQAVREAARRSPMDTKRAADSFPRDRLLCRIFCEGIPSFVVKGGQRMLAYTTSARETRDVDVVCREATLDRALEELQRLIAIDLDDFFRFEVISVSPIKAADEYRDGLTVKVSVFCGAQRLAPISIDLVIDPTFTGAPRRMAPASRLDIGGVPVFDYLLYPAEHVIADKVCATLSTYEGRPSSRVKDLVDLGVIALSESVDGSRGIAQLSSELKIRRIGAPARFTIPSSWEASGSATFGRLSRQTGFAEQLANLDACLRLVQGLVDPLLDGSAEAKSWNPEQRLWGR